MWQIMDYQHPIKDMDINFNIELKVSVLEFFKIGKKYQISFTIMSGCVRKARLAAARGRGGQAGGRAGAGAGQGEAQLPAAARLPAEEAEQRAQELDL